VSQPFATFCFVQSGSAASDLFEARDLVDKFSTSFEPGLYLGQDAKRIVEVCSEIKRFTDSISLRAANRAVEAKVPESDGHKNSGVWLSEMTGESVGKATADLQAARSIESPPDISEAFSEGRINQSQASEAASAADSDPAKAAKLVDAAQNLSRSEFQKTCRETKAASHSAEDEIARHERMRKARSCRIYTDQDGFGYLSAKMTPDAMAIISAALEPYRKRNFEEARKSANHESQAAYLADALVDLASGSDGGGKARHQILVRVDLPVLEKGYAHDGEVCELPGFDAPIPAEVVRNLIPDSILQLLLMEGEDIRAVCTSSRNVKKAIEIALLERDRKCVVPGCEVKQPLERHHWITDYSENQKTDLEGLARICPHHHDEITHRGSRIDGGPGHWRLVRPTPLEEDRQPPSVPPERSPGSSKRTKAPPLQDTLL
jgi:hypothetical protein